MKGSKLINLEPKPASFFDADAIVHVHDEDDVHCVVFEPGHGVLGFRECSRGFDANDVYSVVEVTLTVEGERLSAVMPLDVAARMAAALHAACQAALEVPKHCSS